MPDRQTLYKRQLTQGQIERNKLDTLNALITVDFLYDRLFDKLNFSLRS